MDIKRKLKDWLKQSDEKRKSLDLYVRLYRIRRTLEFMEQYDSAKAWENMQAKRARRRTLHLVGISSGAVAVFLAIFAVSYFMMHHTPAENELQKSELLVDYFPEKGSRKAILQLENGEEIDLTAKEGKIQADEGTVAISTSGKSLSYVKQEKENRNAQIQYNTLKVPRGGEYQLVLEDGTKVWLNAESSLHYPTRFIKEREVVLMGEGYFEVSKDKKRPFIIKMGANRVEVLGTKFNVSAYPGSNVYTTLSEGKVKVCSSRSSVTLSPDNQAVISGAGDIKVSQVDAHLFTSWAKGIYEFRRMPLKDIVSQLSRWYDVDILFKDEKLGDKKFAGVIFREDDLNFAIEIIEKVSNVNFVRKGTTIYITEK